MLIHVVTFRVYTNVTYFCKKNVTITQNVTFFVLSIKSCNSCEMWLLPRGCVGSNIAWNSSLRRLFTMTTTATTTTVCLIYVVTFFMDMKHRCEAEKSNFHIISLVWKFQPATESIFLKVQCMAEIGHSWWFNRHLNAMKCARGNMT